MKASRFAAVMFVLLLSLAGVSLTLWVAGAAQAARPEAPGASLDEAYGAWAASAVPAGIQGTIVSITHFTDYPIPQCPQTFNDTIFMPEEGMIQDLNIGLNATHPNRGALKVTLTAPNSDLYLLVENSGSFANLDVWIDQESLNPPGVPPLAHDPGEPYYENDWQPLGSLAGLYGLSSFGDWQIQVCDTVMTDTGVMNLWSLSLELVGFQAHLGSSHFVAPAKVGWGEPITYQVVIKNDDQATISDVFLTDPIPAGLSYHHHACTADYTCAYDPGTATLTGFGDILPGSQAVVTLTAFAETLGFYTNTAILHAPVLTMPLALKTNSVVVPQVYHIWDFEQNDGGLIANDVPEGWEWRDAYFAPAPFHSGPLIWGTASSGAYLADATLLLTQTINLTGLDAQAGLILQWWEWAEIDPGDDFAVLTVNGVEKHYLVGTLSDWTHRQVDLSEFAGQIVTLVWRMHSGPDSFVGRGWYLDDISVHAAVPGVDLSVFKSDHADPALVGQPLTYTVEVINYGFLTATGVTAVDYLPVGTELVRVDPANLNYSYDPAQNTVLFLIDRVPPLGYVPFTVVVTNLLPTPRLAVNFISVSSHELDVTPADNSFTQYTTIVDQLPTGPYITSIYPLAGINNEPVTVTVTGGNFQPGALVFLENSGLSLSFPAVVASPDLVEFQVPAGAPPGTYDVQVRNPDGQSGLLRNGYTIAPDLPPVINAVFPSRALNDTPVVIDIFGDYFYPVDFSIYLEGRDRIASFYLDDAGFIDSQHLRAIVPINLPEGPYTLTLISSLTGIPVSLPNAYTALSPATTDDLFTLGWFDFWAYPRAVQAGATITLGVNMRRLGGQADLNLTPVDFYANGLFLERGFAALAAPNSITPVTITWQAPITPGLYTLSAVLDPDNWVTENDEFNNVVTRTLRVHPFNPDDLPPEVISVTLNYGNWTTEQRQVVLNTQVSSDTTHLLLIEYRFIQAAHGWRAVANSGWLPAETVGADYPWLLTPGAGLHYLQVWAADGAGNISPMPRQDYINFLPGMAFISQGEVHLYRSGIMAGVTLRVRLSSLSGDADFYIFGPDGGLIYAAESGNPVEEFEFTAPLTGQYQFEIEGYTSAEYRLEFLVLSSPSPEAWLATYDPNGRPRDQPFTLLPPGGEVGLPETPVVYRYLYLPLIVR